MIPRDLFEKMAALALVAIALCGVLSIRAFALDMEDKSDDPAVQYHDSGPLPGDLGGVSSDSSSSLADNILAIRQDMDILLYFVIPCSVAVLIIYLLCKWFCRTFVDSVL